MNRRKLLKMLLVTPAVPLVAGGKDEVYEAAAERFRFGIAARKKHIVDLEFANQRLKQELKWTRAALYGLQYGVEQLRVLEISAREDHGFGLGYKAGLSHALRIVEGAPGVRSAALAADHASISLAANGIKSWDEFNCPSRFSDGVVVHRAWINGDEIKLR